MRRRGRAVVLTGFMGTGKSVVGRELARLLGWRFVDADEVIARRAGMSIPEIFRRLGERAFRAMEREVVTELCRGGEVVVAVGGGAIVDPRNLERMRECGLVVCLTASEEEILRRMEGVSDRPLLQVSDRRGRVAELLSRRARHYAKADAFVDTTGKSPTEVAREVLDIISRWREGAPAFGMEGAVMVRAPSGEYPVVVRPGALAEVGSLLREVGVEGGRVAFIFDPRAAEKFGAIVRESLREADFKVVEILLPEGEACKDIEVAKQAWGRLAKEGFGRDDCVVALGGGAAGDLAGFVAATYARGIAWAVLPTTLLAQVDSSVGGKTAVNLPGVKNLVGAFHQPRLVVSDPEVLRSLPQDSYKDGFAEVVKYGVIKEPGILDLLERGVELLLQRDSIALAEVIRRCVKVKGWVVERDERERGLRAILNYGHTVGHAIEVATGMSHGRAVSVGMACEAEIAVRMGLCHKGLKERQDGLLRLFGLPTEPPKVDLGKFSFALSRDKKARKGRVRFVLPRALGWVEVREDVPLDLVLEVVGLR